jgi:hypothetical protein
MGAGYWILPRTTSRLGSSMCGLPAACLPVPGLLSCLTVLAATGYPATAGSWFSGVRAQPCAIRPAGSAPGRTAGCGYGAAAAGCLPPAGELLTAAPATLLA